MPLPAHLSPPASAFFHSLSPGLPYPPLDLARASPPANAPGRLLSGSLSLGQLKRGGGAAPHHFSISYLVPPAAAAAAAPAAKDEPGRAGRRGAAAVERLLVMPL